MSSTTLPLGRRAYAVGLRLGLVRPLLALGGRYIASKRVMRRGFAGWTPAASDVVVATFMKSGTNWMMQIALQIAHRGSAEYDHIHDLVPWPDAPRPDQVVSLDDLAPLASSPTGLRIIKTHGDAAVVPITDPARYIVVLRDPKEVIVSAYHFALPLLGLQERVDPSLWHRLLAKRGARLWAEHAASWWRLRDAPNVCVLRFPDMKADLGGAVDRVAAFMGVTLTDAERARVLERSAFSWMKAENARFRPIEMPFYAPNTLPQMVRRGAAGGASELYSHEQLAAIDDAVVAHIKARGLDLPYETLFDRA